MRIVTIILFFVGLALAAEQQSYEEEINLFINKWKKGSVNTDLFFFPSLKIINVGIVEGNYEGMGLRMDFKINGMNITGLNNFTVNSLKVTSSKNKGKVNITMEFPELLIFSDEYNIKGKAYYVYPIKGEGNMRIKFVSFTVTLNLYLDFNNKTGINLENLDLDFDVKEIKADLEKSSWPLNNILNSKGITILKTFREDIISALKYYVVPYVNNICENYYRNHIGTSF